MEKEKFEDWHETHFEIVSAINDQLNGNGNFEFGVAYTVACQNGRGGLYELAKDLTDKFEELYSETIWGEDLYWSDTIEEFVKKELYK